MKEQEPSPSNPLRPVRDLAGTPAADAGGLPIGAVFGALIEADSGLIRYLDVALEGEDRHVLVPIGHTRVRREGGDVEIRLRAATHEDLEAIPPYTPGHSMDDTFQERLLGLHGRVFYGERYYAHPSFDHSGLYAGGHPIVRGPSAPIHEAGVHPLTELAGYDIAEHEPDVRGWPLLAAHAARFGTVSELLVDPDAGKVRYVVAEPDSGAPPVAVPVGYVTLDATDGQVHVPALHTEDLAALPPYVPGEFDRAAEERIRAAVEARLTGERRFERADFNAEDESDQRLA